MSFLIVSAWLTSFCFAPAQDVSSTKPVSITLDGCSGKEAWLRMFEVTGISYDSSEVPWNDVPDVNLGLLKKPYWATVRSLCRVTKLGVFANYGKLSLLPSTTWATRPSSMSSGMMFLAESIAIEHFIDCGDPDKTSHEMTLEVVVYPDPNLQIADTELVFVLKRAVDDANNNLMIARKGGSEFVVPVGSLLTDSDRNLIYFISIPTQYHLDLGKTCEVGGTLRFETAERISEVEFDDISRQVPQSRTLANRRVTVTSVTDLEPGFFLDYQIDSVSALGGGVTPEVRVFDRDDVQLECRETTVQKRGGLCKVRIVIKGSSPPWKAVLAQMETTSREVHCNIANIPLPKVR